MLSRTHGHAQRGVTMVELIVGMVVFGVLTALALPSVTGYLQNSRVRSLASSFVNGAQLARTEAIKNNAPVDFVVTDTPLSAAAVQGAVANGNGHNWIVRSYPVAPATDFVRVDAKAAAEGHAESVSVVGTAGLLTFNGLGSSGVSATYDFTLPSAGACAPSGPIRCLRMVVSPGGQARLCDPAVASGDTRSC